ncbi:MAG: histidine kinase [Hyphomicrobium sp.]|nr:histidine kinase [Hyphomicrobium sp.]
MSIRFRLNALIIAVFTLGLVLLMLAMVLSAGPRIRAENDSIMRLATEFVETTIESLQGTTDPGARLAVLLDGLKDLRHVQIYRVNDPGSDVVPEDGISAAAPSWLARLGRPSSTAQVPVRVNGQDFGTLVIAPRLADEAAEIWSSIVSFSLGGAALAVTAVLLMSVTIAYLLKPIKRIGDALMVLEAGRYDVAVPESGPPEISDICRKLNRLATTLESTISENRRLAQRIIRVQDEERKDLARELHDELGPYLFAIRAAIAALKSELQRGGSDREKLLRTCDTLVERMETIQRMNRGVLQKLRPMGLEEYGLKAKLTSLLALLRESHPHVRINLAVAADLPACDETSNLTLYRLVQEGLTNALRHAEATVVDIAIEPAPADDVPEVKDKTRPVIHVAIADNGRGLPEGVKASYGIAGMSERVWATGGEMRMTNRAGGGLTLDAWVPVSFAGAAPSGGALVETRPG